MKSIKLNFIFSSLKGLMSVLFPVISFPYVSRVIGVDGIGKVEYCQSIISYFALFAALGISLYAVREGAKVRGNRKELSKFSREIFIINLITTFITYLGLFIFLMFPVMNGYEILLIVCSLSIILTTLNIEWLYQIVEDYQYISIRSVIIQVLALAAMFIFVKNENDCIIYALISVLSTGGAFLFNLFHSKKYVDLLKITSLNLMKHLKPILIIFGISVASSIYLNMDKVMLGAMSGDYSVGLYSASVKLNTIVKTLISSISLVVLPRLSSYLANGNIKSYERLLKDGINLNIALSLPIAAGMIILAKPLLLLFSGYDYLDAYFSSQILSVNIIFSAIDALLYYQVLLPFGKEKEACIGTTLGAIVNLLLNFLFIPYWNINGASIATLLSEICVFMYFLYIIYSIIDLKKMVQELWKILISAVIIIPVVVLCSIIINDILLLTVVSVIISCIVYFGCLLLLRFSLCNLLINDIKSMVSKIKL